MLLVRKFDEKEVSFDYSQRRTMRHLADDKRVFSDVTIHSLHKLRDLFPYRFVNLL